MLQLRTDQIARLAHYIGQPKCLDLSDPGTGKTPPVVVNQFRRWQDSELPTLWVQPKALMFKNRMEICRFTPFTSDDVAIVDGTPKKVKAALNSGARVLCMGPDRFKRVLADIPSMYKAMDVDEFHMCFGGAGTPSVTGAYTPSGRVSAFYSYPIVEGVFMTGTLINGRLDTAYPAIQKIEPNYYPFGYEQFLGTHAILDENLRPIAWQNHDRLRQILARHGVRFTFEQIFGKQEVVHETTWVDMSPKQRAMFDQFKEQAYLELHDFMVNGTEPGQATIRARQIMEHPNAFPDLRDPDGKLPPVDICPGERPAKLDILEIDFEDQNRRGEPIIVFAAYKRQMEQIAELARKMGRKVAPVMNGDTSAKARRDADEGFQAGHYDTIVGSQAVCSVGYNWQFCGEVETSLVVNASLSYMDSDYIQGYRRAIRGKRTIPLRVKTLAYFDSVDLKVMNILERKSRDANLVDPTREVLQFSG
jgi:hypothetical protein